MPLIYPWPFPSESSRDPIEFMRYAHLRWSRDQKWRAGTFAFSATVPGNTISVASLTDVTVGGSDTGVDNLVPGMWLSVSPPKTIDPNMQVGWAMCPGAGKLSFQLINGTVNPIAVTGPWAYVGFVIS